MTEKQNKINRRNFMRTMGTVGLGSVLALSGCKKKPEAARRQKPADRSEKNQIGQLPRRKLGKTGLEVPVLALGMMFNAVDKQIVLRKALQYGITYWDTAHNYSGGNSELGIGKFLTKNQALRKKLFIASKASDTATIDEVEKRLQTSLQRMHTDYIDLYYLHNIKATDRLNDDLREWADSAKKRKLIRFFGFTTHANMTELLEFGAKLEWIDAIMHSYNFRLMQDEKLNAAIDTCHKAGIALIAMKTQGQQQKKIETDEDRKMVEHFLSRGFTHGQAKLKAVLADKRFSAVCIGRDNLEHLALNVAAVHDKTRLTREDMDVLAQYAYATCSRYCAGCANICDSALPDTPYVSDIMRYLMYYNSYGEHDDARARFAGLPPKVRNKLLAVDYSRAEARCPQHLPIAELIAEAVAKLA